MQGGILKYFSYFLNFPQKIFFDISCSLFPKEEIKKNINLSFAENAQSGKYQVGSEQAHRPGLAASATMFHYWILGTLYAVLTRETTFVTPRLLARIPLSAYA